MSLVIGDGSTSSFSQQGTIDWVQLGNCSFSATVSILSRLSAANVDPLTLAVAQAVAGQFKLSRHGKERLREALQSLKCFNSLGDVLWFGFGVKHIVRVLAQTTQGMCAIALCGSLSTVMSTEMVAYILDELPEFYKAPPDLRPSLSQWEALANVCAGTLSSTNFGSIAEHFMSLNGDTILSPDFSLVSVSKLKRRLTGEPKDIAAALQAISRLSSGSLISIELHGGATCGLLAAVASWFLGLDVEIRKNGTIVHRSVSEKHPVQILVQYYGKESRPIHSEETQVTSTSYHIFSVASILDPGDLKRFQSVGGRVSWENALRATFGASGKRLLQYSYHFGQILGSAARIFAAVANSERDSPERRTLGLWRGAVVHNEQGHGSGLVDFMFARLPELAAVNETTVRECLKYRLARACEEFETAMKRMAMQCSCHICNGPHNFEGRHDPFTFCIPKLATVVVLLVRNLSLVHPDVDVQPYRVGLERLYHSYQPCFFDLPRKHIQAMLGHTSMQNVYQTAEFVYTGNDEQSSSENSHPSAFSTHGTVFYLDILRELSDRPGNAGILHVAPGNLALQSGRHYPFAKDLQYKGGPSYNATNYQPLLSLPSPLDTSNVDLAGKLAVKESVGALSIEFRFTQAGSFVCAIGATELVNCLAQVSYSVYCRRRMCSELRTPLTSVFTVDGEGLVVPTEDVEAGRLTVIRRLQGNAMARCIALFQIDGIARHDHISRLLEPRNVILRSDECWSCCIKAALRRPRVTYII